MTNEDDRLALRVDDALGHGNVIFERESRIPLDAIRPRWLLRLLLAQCGGDDLCELSPVTHEPLTADEEGGRAVNARLPATGDILEDALPIGAIRNRRLDLGRVQIEPSSHREQILGREAPAANQEK